MPTDHDTPAEPVRLTTADHDTPAEPARLTAWVRGSVQGVGYRWRVRARALELGLRGRAANLPDGRVEVVAEGPRAACEALLEALPGLGHPGVVTGAAHRWSAPQGGLTGFVEG